MDGHRSGFASPPGYQPRSSDVGIYFGIFEWLDDDTLALGQRGFSVIGDIIVCHLSDGRCHLAVKATPPDKARIVAGESLPG